MILAKRDVHILRGRRTHPAPILSLEYSELTSNWIFLANTMLSSPRAGPKGLRAESARAFTGRRNSYSGKPNFFAETAVTPERKVEKWFPKWEINRHAQG